MSWTMRVRTLVIALAVASIYQAAWAQFFLGVPSPSFNATSGTITSTPTATANNPNKELDMSGQFDVTNATPLVQTSSFTTTCQLDPTYNFGNPINAFLQINQSGFVSVPAGGTIYGWTLTATIAQLDGTTAPGSLVVAQWPANPTPYGPGVTTYGPTTTLGGTFLYNPANASQLVLTFTSTFDGLAGPNVYTWDFPASVTFTAVPEPASYAMFGTGALLLWAGRRQLLRKRK